MGPRSSTHVTLVASALALPLAMVASAFLFEPDPRGHGTHEQLGLPACGVRDWLGVPCPACGCTTAVVQVWRGDPLHAFATQPFGALVGVALPVLAVLVLVAHLRGRDVGPVVLGPRGARAVRWALVALLFGWAWKWAAGS